MYRMQNVHYYYQRNRCEGYYACNGKFDREGE